METRRIRNIDEIRTLTRAGRLHSLGEPQREGLPLFGSEIEGHRLSQGTSRSRIIEAENLGQRFVIPAGARHDSRVSLFPCPLAGRSGYHLLLDKIGCRIHHAMFFKHLRHAAVSARSLRLVFDISAPQVGYRFAILTQPDLEYGHTFQPRRISVAQIINPVIGGDGVGKAKCAFFQLRPR